MFCALTATEIDDSEKIFFFARRAKMWRLTRYLEQLDCDVNSLMNVNSCIPDSSPVLAGRGRTQTHVCCAVFFDISSRKERFHTKVCTRCNARQIFFSSASTNAIVAFVIRLFAKQKAGRATRHSTDIIFSLVFQSKYIFRRKERQRDRQREGERGIYIYREGREEMYQGCGFRDRIAAATSLPVDESYILIERRTK